MYENRIWLAKNYEIIENNYKDSHIWIKIE